MGQQQLPHLEIPEYGNQQFMIKNTQQVITGHAKDWDLLCVIIYPFFLISYVLSIRITTKQT